LEDREREGRRYQKERLDFSGKHPQNPELSRMLLQKHLKWWAINYEKHLRKSRTSGRAEEEREGDHIKTGV